MNDMNKQMHYVLYHSDESDVSVNAVVQNDSIWVTQKAMAELFNVNLSSISRHLKNIFEEGELNEEVVIAKIATTIQHGALEGKTQTKEVNSITLMQLFR